MRRRLRQQTRIREALLVDLGALVYELHRHGRREPELLQAKAAELTAVDEEVRGLAEALDADEGMLALVTAGIAGSCENCGSLLSTDARYCGACGAPAAPAIGATATTPREVHAEQPVGGPQIDELEIEEPLEEQLVDVPLAEPPPEEEAGIEPPPEEEEAAIEPPPEEEQAPAEESSGDESPAYEEPIAPWLVGKQSPRRDADD